MTIIGVLQASGLLRCGKFCIMITTTIAVIIVVVVVVVVVVAVVVLLLLVCWHVPEVDRS